MTALVTQTDAAPSPTSDTSPASTQGDSPVGLFDAVTLRGQTFRNRLWVAPMCQYSAEEQDGVATDWHLVHLGSLARGGAGAVISEAASVTPDGRISPQDLGIWNDDQVEALKPITAFVRSQGSVPGIQLAHAGRKASTFRPWSETQGSVPEAEGGWPTVAPSAVAFEGYAAPRELTRDEVVGLVEAFRAAARRSVEAGFGLIELHAAHGYLLHQFLSPLSNERTDEYGGSLENRARLLVDVVRAVRAEVGDDLPLLVRFSATDWAEGGWDEHETATVAAWSRDAGADLFDISTGGLVAGVTIPVGLGYQVPFAQHVRETAEVETGAVGLIVSARQAQAVVAEGRADVVLMAREFLRDPHFPLRAAAELGVELDYWPEQYLRAPFRAS
ncbi:2,4-dienoyl-CoA reductase-like NADH-dependent reductase (Old Yellow Enzyme family) [Frigoribacterium sp. PhB107]|uniref:NADH:flavin oxidoreductase/NADH oxidase n=1 Tax=Frigoribacterium sp. PhB107 TaxID=2485172 RepID=UPI000F476863|nr:NADH:flavin oxidoreductase/NADH oxidase [Frigoribacterium sp. PhB107]ROP78064.1 2,4-dienoyl-CoA reductase-like NADH-dependent reductase (Old Yellow Enzyme family) [Frigoribacterium sp. PhB107]